MGPTSFVEPFVTKVFYEDLGMIYNFLMLIDLSTTFAMFLLCYAQCPNYLLRTMFPFPSILQHYAKFDIRIITTLEKLLIAGSSGSFINHLAYCLVIPTSSNGFNLFFMV